MTRRDLEIDNAIINIRKHEMMIEILLWRTEFNQNASLLMRCYSNGNRELLRLQQPHLSAIRCYLKEMIA